MLQKLYIKNYAIIDEISIEFDQHLNVITGETGAGKSIILGAISLILGERADSSVLINADEKCIVEAQFDTQDNVDFNTLLLTHDLDKEHPTIIRREIATSGKSRAFINDSPVTLSVLNELSRTLVDLHKQFDNRALDDSRFVYQSLDAVAQSTTLVKDYQTALEALKTVQKKQQKLLADQEQWQKEADYNQFLYEELATAQFLPKEIETIEQTLQQLGNTELIQNTLTETHLQLLESEQALIPELKKLNQKVSTIAKYLPEAESLVTRFNSCYEELKDLAQECHSLQQQVDLDPSQLNQLQERYDLGMKLLKKHGCTQTDELIAIYEALSEKILEQNNADQALATLSMEITEKETELKKLAKEISILRQASSPQFSASINEMLHLVGMPNAQFAIELKERDTFNPFGTDQVQFLLDANKSGKFNTVQKAASGGELSRIMLSIKTLTAKALHMPTLIFDEVDSGISGEAALQVGTLLRSLGEYHQILCITHQPQVAGKGHQHYYVYKTKDEAKVNTRIKQLNRAERVRLIATMIGGNQPSAAAIDNANELVSE